MVLDSERVARILYNTLQSALSLSDRDTIVEILVSKPAPVNATDKGMKLEFTVNFMKDRPLSPTEITGFFSVTDEENIGLHIAKQICTKLGGDLTVASLISMTSFTL